MQTAHELFVHELQDMLSAERKLIDALKEQEENATRPELKKAFASHRAQTEKQVQRLEQAFESIGEEPEETECKGIEGLIEEYQTFVEEEEPAADILDHFAVGAAIKVENYEICAYEGLIDLAEQMEHTKAVRLLQQNLREEETTLEKLEKLGDKLEIADMGMEEESESDEESSPQRKQPGQSGKRGGRSAA